ncbi:HD domain-containing phosphohydrolase [Herbivorax sp. ANBcel31]|uniref:HD domain-containing phosphohydrolase n=1 Tax=Herbivorax sp. ANBcel31 TaxID=3069754 RepID=UPI0027B24501|nr:HD domain-containing phosphohydrolase [Herbivorax sp. ANBcel31]MDQ2087070.1 HD domain-containing phosphohydrolase [Herbivorax sp. ANBcel31]
MENKLKQLEEENRMFRMILEALPINLFVKDTNCNYQVTSKICDIINGVNRGELKGKTDFDIQKSKEIAQSFYDDDKKIMNTKKGSRMLSPTLCGETVKYYDIYKEPLIGEDGSVEGILGLVVAPAEMSTDEKVEEVENEMETYYGIKCLMFDYDIKTGNAIILKELEDFNIKYDTSESFEKVFINSQRIKEQSKEAVKKAFQKIKDYETESVVVLDIKDNSGNWRSGVLNLTRVKNSKLNENRVIGVLSYLNDGEEKKEELMISLNAMKKRLSQIVTEKYDAVIYINKKNQAYIRKGKPIGKLASQGSIEQLKICIDEYIYNNEKNIYKDAVISKSEINRDGKHLSFELRIMDEKDEIRWYESNVYYMDGIDGVSEDVILTFCDMDEIVKMKKQNEIRNINNRFIEVLGSVVESRDLESGDHIKRIKNITKLLLTAIMKKYPEYGLCEEQIEVMASASTMHDVGKIAIPDNILLKPGRLTPEEFEIMKEHTTRGCKIINSASVIQDEQYYNYCYEICRHHHERYDGKGYPDGLKGDDISISAQAVSVADVYDALISKRCYKEAYHEEKVYSMIINGECGVFNPKLIECLKETRNKLKSLYY